MSDAPTAAPKRKRRASHQSIVLANAKRAAKGRKGGRPLTYHPDLCDRAVALGERGKHWAAIARSFGVSRQTLYKWEADFPEFGDALARARAASQAWWEDRLQNKLGAKHFQAQSAKLVMAGQFEDYREAAKGSQTNGLDLLSLVNAIAQGATAGALQASAGKDDAPTAAQDVVPAGVSFAKPTE
jgi:transposase-like protein